MAVAGIVVATAVLAFLHAEFQPVGAVLVGIVGAVGLRRAVGATYGELPPFLALPIDAGVALFGVMAVSLASMVTKSGLFWLGNWAPPLSLALGTVVLGVGLAGIIYTHSRLRLEIVSQEARLAELRNTAVTAQLGQLQAQVNPHFLFNSLNTLAELVHEDADMAEDLIGDLAYMMRYALRSSTGNVSLSQEIEMVERYLRLERARLGDRLDLQMEVDEAAGNTKIPGLILQPLIENAIKYGVASRKDGGTVTVAVRVVGDEVEIDVSDNGPGLPDRIKARLAGEDTDDGEVGTGGAGGGLANVQRRLQLAYGETPLTHLESPVGTAFQIRIPK